MKKHLLITATALLATTLLVVACAQQPNSNSSNLEQVLNQKQLRAVENTDNILSRRIQSWEYVDAYHLIIKVSFNKQYLLTLKNYCPGLRHGLNISYSDLDGKLDPNDSIHAHDLPAFSARCTIASIAKLQPSDPHLE